MGWFPIGPDFVFAPRNPNFKRLSVRNDAGEQGAVVNIAVDPTDANVIYVVVSAASGTAVFRTVDGATTWTPIADSIAGDALCFAVSPAQPQVVYLGTGIDGAVYVSPDRGDTWGPRRTVGLWVRRLLVDPRTAASPSTTELYAATMVGLYRSTDGGSTWTSVLAGDVTSLAASLPATGTAHFYAAVKNAGLFHATNGAGPWTNLNGAGIGLPAYTPPTATATENFDALLVDLCPLNPNRVYLLAARPSAPGTWSHVSALYTTSSPLVAWSQVPAPALPSPGQGLYSFAFAVAPNSPGNGTSDILFFASYSVHRSIDGGNTWAQEASWFHADQRAFAFAPVPGTVPVLYCGSDGGLARSSRYADPTYAIAAPPTDFSEGTTYTASGAWQNLDLGAQDPALYQYAADPAISALGYVGCQDTGFAAGAGGLGWRGIADADGSSLAATRGSDGVKLWGLWGYFFGAFPGFRMYLWTDKGDYTITPTPVTLGPAGPFVGSVGSYSIGLDGKCLAGILFRESLTTLANALTQTGAQQATPSSMSDIVVGSRLIIDPGLAKEELVTVQSVTASTFTAIFAQTHAAQAAINIEASAVGRIGQDAIARRISQRFGSVSQNTYVNALAASPVDPNLLYAATIDGRLWTTNVGATASAATVWTEVLGSKPAAVGIISSIGLDAAGNVYVLLNQSITTGAGAGAITSPLFKIVGGGLVHQPGSSIPITGYFGALRVDPVQAGTLYARGYSGVSRVTLSAGTWTWQDISAGLPKCPVSDLWIANVGTAAQPKVLLRAALPTRGVWEADVTAGAIDPPVALYVRDNFLDQGWLPVSPDGLPSPYAPTDPASTVFHYHCADLKIDAKQRAGAGLPDFFQTDPEGPLPLSHVLFDMLRDNSSNLPGSDLAQVHVQVRNRSWTASSVQVWAIYCNASAGVPALSASPSQGNAFAFWSQFAAGGQIAPNLPADSPWTAVGAPVTLNGIDAAHPRVATWSWTVPLLSTGDPGHYCMVVFVHSATSSITALYTSMSVDDVTPRNRQVGQKNLHVGAPLPPTPSRGGEPFGPLAPQPGEYVEFHNPTAATRNVELVFDMRGVPAQIAASLRLTRLDTARPLDESMTGVVRARKLTAVERGAESVVAWWRSLVDWFALTWCRVVHVLRALVGVARRTCVPRRQLPRFEPIAYELARSARVEIRGVRIQPFAKVAGQLSLRTVGAVEEGSAYRFEVLQQEGENPRGGGTYVVRVAGEARVAERVVPPSHQPGVPDSEREREEHEEDESRGLPPWIAPHVEERERREGKRP